MTISTFAVGAAVTPTVVKTYVSHYANRKPRKQKPTAHISYDEGLHLIRSFLTFASHHTVEDLQAFTSQWVPHPRWVKLDPLTISPEHISKAADIIISQLGNRGIDKIGGSKWWQWRRKGAELRAEWIEMRSDYNERKRRAAKGTRVMLYLHGGAYFFGGVDEHRYQMQRHARKLNARVLAPRYRLAPQYPFPCALQDCLATYLYLLTMQDPTEIILAGDSAGGGLAVSLMCMLRDQNIPLPAGAILISPWVDLTHSFPSVAGGSRFDYIPAHGFMQKPSLSWPPPNEDEIEAIAEGAIQIVAGEALPRKSTHQERKSAELEAIQGFAVYHGQGNDPEAARQNSDNPAHSGHANPRGGNLIPGPGHQLSIELDGNLVVLKDQIQMYTTNQLISHPLVSPVLQPSLGGLPPLLVLTGGGEILRDEQIFLAHKAANPAEYCLEGAYREEYDPEDAILKKYKPTPVHLQVWDDLCHVAPTLSFTRPAKYMYRSIAQFGAWALARAQNTSIEIMDDDDISIISAGETSDSDADNSTDSVAKTKTEQSYAIGKVGRVGKAGDPIPTFRNHMIRQRVDRHGDLYALPPPEEIPALQVPKDQVGVLKAGPVRKWLEAKKGWDMKYARVKRKVQKQRIKEMAAGGPVGFGAGENPPPSALAGRRKKDDIGDEGAERQRQKKSMGLAMWSMVGSKHDETTIRREEDAVQKDEKAMRATSAATRTDASIQQDDATRGKKSSSSARRSGLQKQAVAGIDRSHSRRRTVTVRDSGQTEDQGAEGAVQQASSSGTKLPPQGSAHLSPLFLPQIKTHAPHLRTNSFDRTDSASVQTGMISGDVESLRNASTTAVFAAPGVISSPGQSKSVDRSDLLTHPDDVDERLKNGTSMRGEVASMLRPETPASGLSVERLQEHQLGLGDENSQGDLRHFRNPSNIAVVRVAGVVEPLTQEGVTGEADDIASEKSQRPGMYDRSDTQFRTAVEAL